MAKITRIDRKKSFTTIFKFENGNEGIELEVPIDQADSYQTKIENASWAIIQTLWLKNGETIIKETP